MPNSSENANRYPGFPSFSTIDGPAVYSGYQYGMLYQQCDILNRKIMKALHGTLSAAQKGKLRREEDGLVTLSPNEIGFKDDSIECVMFDGNTFEVIDAFLKGVSPEDVCPLRVKDYAMDRLEKYVPEDIWLEGLSEADRTAVRNAIRKGAENIPLGVAVERYAPLFWRIDVIRRVGMLPTYSYGSIGLDVDIVCYSGRIVVELIYSVFREDGYYEMPLGLWPVSNYEAKILDFFNALSKRMTPAAEAVLQKRVDVIAGFLKGQSPVIRDHELTRYHALARERFPMALDEDIYRALRSVTDSEILLKEPKFNNRLVAPWKK